MKAELFEVFEAGGWPGRALAFVSISLWMVVWIRASRLSSSVVDRFEATAQGIAGSAARLERLLDRTGVELSAGREILRALVVAAPLLGLLGTVSGMVELFNALHGGAAAASRGSVAGGISTALVTTQLGLVVGVPGLMAARFLEQRERQLRAALDHVLTRLRRAGEEVP